MKKLFSAVILLNLTLFIWSADLTEIQSRGYITAGIRKISTAIYLGEEYTNKGFCHDIVKAFADNLDVDLDLRIVKNFTDYWKKDGVIVFKTNSTDTPDIYKEIDLAADIITLTDQREKFVNMVPFIENTEIFVGRKDLEMHSYDDLRGLRLFTLESIGFYQLIKDELNKRDIPFVVNKVSLNEKTGDMNYLPGKGEVPLNGVEILIIPKDAKHIQLSSYHQILLGHADITIQDSFSFFLHYSSSDTIKDGLKSMFPVNGKIGSLAFCTSYNTVHLNKKLAEFMKQYRKSDRFNKLFITYLGITYQDYQVLLNMSVR